MLKNLKTRDERMAAVFPQLQADRVKRLFPFPPGHDIDGASKITADVMAHAIARYRALSTRCDGYYYPATHRAMVTLYLEHCARHGITETKTTV